MLAGEVNRADLIWSLWTESRIQKAGLLITKFSYLWIYILSWVLTNFPYKLLWTIMDTLWTVVITQLQSIAVGKHFTVTIIKLSHTWVRYPGFSGHGVKCPILTTVAPGFSGDLIGCTIRSKWGSFGDLYLARKNLLCVWNKLFLAEIQISQRRTRPVKSLWWQIVHMQESTNEWKNLTSFEIMGLAGTQW